MLLHILTLLPDMFARGGGGGSGGGGGGGGGSGGGGGGIFVLLGYIPMHFIGSLFRKHGETTFASVIQQVLGWLIAVAYAIVWTYFGGIYGFLIGAAGLFGMAAGLYNWFGKIKQSDFVKKRLKNAAAADAMWNEEGLVNASKTLFTRYQQDWATFNVASMQTYMSPRYYQKASLLMAVLKAMQRTNQTTNVTFEDVSIVDAADDIDNKKDAFTVGFSAKAHDQILRADGTSLFTTNEPFVEYWHFVRGDSLWLLDDITQGTQNNWSLNPTMQQFAANNGYCYSADMGWLFIPERGQLFGGAKFGVSDINNHIVGLYKDQLLVQLYSYVPAPQSSNSHFVIAQVNVPKSYGNIVVRRKKGLRLFGIRGLEKVSTEWTTFNDMYEVYATSAEQATSFELLNPTYMEQLAAVAFEVNIEVVDNVVYLYTPEGKADVTTYQTMLDLLHKAFAEMKL